MKLVRTDFRKILKYQISRKYVQVFVPFGRTVSHTQSDGQTDMAELTVAFRNFANAPKKATENAHIFCRGFFK
jgi:hypothetical protein